MHESQVDGVRRAPRWRRWSERLALILVIVLWLGGTLVAFAVNWSVGIALLCVGGVYAGGELWFARHGDEHPTLNVVWVAAWRAIEGAVLVAIGVIYLRWDSLVLFVLGGWFLALAAALVWAIWHERRGGQRGVRSGA